MLVFAKTYSVAQVVEPQQPSRDINYNSKIKFLLV